MDNLAVKNTILINADVNKVWNLLVNPEQTPKYMFGCKTISNWQVGSTLIWEMLHEGKPFIPVSGYILSIEPNKLLKYSVIDPHATYEITLENHLHVTYILEEENRATKLTVLQDHFVGVDSEKRYKDVYNNGEGWNPILVQIKALAENN